MTDLKADLIADAKERLAREPERRTTHSENCHRKHDACLIARLLVRAERLAEIESRPVRYWLVEHEDCRDQVFFSLSGAREAANDLGGGTVTELIPRCRC